MTTCHVRLKENLTLWFFLLLLLLLAIVSEIRASHQLYWDPHLQGHYHLEDYGKRGQSFERFFLCGLPPATFPSSELLWPDRTPTIFNACLRFFLSFSLEFRLCWKEMMSGILTLSYDYSRWFQALEIRRNSSCMSWSVQLVSCMTMFI